MAEKTAKPRKAAKTAVAPAAETAETTPQRITFAMEEQPETKTFAKFTPPKDSGCVGTLYVPKGSKVVKVLVEG